MAPMVMATFSSSSTIRTLPLAMFDWTLDRQRDAEGRPPPRATAQLDRATVSLHDALRNPQSQPRALFVLGREKGFEDVRQVLLFDAFACIAYLDVDRVRHQKFRVG